MTALVCLVPLQKMVWLDDKEERKRILMDLRVMTSHRSPYIVQYYGSVIWNVRALSVVCDGVGCVLTVCLIVCALSVVCDGVGVCECWGARMPCVQMCALALQINLCGWSNKFLSPVPPFPLHTRTSPHISPAPPLTLHPCTE